MNRLLRRLRRCDNTPRPGFRQDGWAEYPGETEPTQYTKADALHPWPDTPSTGVTR